MRIRQGKNPNQKRLFYGWYIVASIFFMVFVSAGFRQSYGLFIPSWIDEFDVSVSTISFVSAGGWVINGIAQPIVGRLSDQYGARVVMIWSTLILGISTIGMAFATGIWVLAFFYGIFGSFAVAGAQFTPVTPLISRWFIKKRGMALSFLTSGGSAGAMLIVPLSAFLMAMTNWRWSLFALAAVILLLAMPLVFLVVRNDPKEIGVFPDGEQDSDGFKNNQRSMQEGPLAVSRWPDSYRSAPMWQLTLSYIVCGVTTAIISVHFVQYAKTEGIDETSAAIAFGLLSFMNLMGVLFLGFVSDKVKRKNALAVIYAFRGIGFLSLLIFPSSYGIWVFSVIAGSSWLASVPQTSALAAEVYGIRNAGTITGMLSMVHMIAGAVAVAAAGLNFDIVGTYDLTWLSSFVLLIAAAVISFSLNERQYSARYNPVYSGA